MISDNEQVKEYDGVYYGNDKNKPLKRKIMYICNQKKCGVDCSSKDGCCFHTTDIRFAKNYMSVPPNKTLEKHFYLTRMVLDEPTLIFTERMK